MLQKLVPLKIQVLADGFLADRMLFTASLNAKSSLKWQII